MKLTADEFQELDWYYVVSNLAPKLEFATRDYLYPKIAMTNQQMNNSLVTFKLIQLKNDQGFQYTLMAYHEHGQTELMIWEPKMSHVKLVTYVKQETFYKTLNKPVYIDVMTERIKQLETRNKELEDKLIEIQKLIGEL